jgi:hypothetical protein
MAGSTDIDLVYDPVQGAWYTWEYKGRDTRVISDMAMCGDNGVAIASEVASKSSDAFADPATAPGTYESTIRTNWVKISGIGGYGRVWWVRFIGKWLAAHTLSISVCYDYDTTTYETVTHVSATEETPYEWGFKPKKQKCTSVQFLITITATTTAGAGMTALELECGVKSKKPMSQAKTE